MALLHVGLTGGIGSGKSTVGAMLVKRGAVLLDADVLSRASTARGGEAIGAIANAFGARFIDKDGGLDRPRMRELVFSDPDAKSRLEAIVHPVVQSQLASRVDTARARHVKLLVSDIPLLVESPQWLKGLNTILVVDCLRETQIARVMERSLMDRAQVSAVIAAQADRRKRMAAADAVIWNEGLSLSALDLSVGQWLQAFGL